MSRSKIVYGIFSVGILYFMTIGINRIIEIFIFVKQGVSTISLIGKIINVVYYIGICIDPILAIILFKFLCEVLYKIIKFIDLYTDKLRIDNNLKK